MLIFRPANFSDLPDIEHLAVIAGNSMTTLPNNRDHLAELINNTRRSLKQNVTTPSDQSYHFVLEDSETQHILGICGIEAYVGYEIPFYSYCCDQLEHKSQELQIENTIATLSLSQDYEGASRLCTFFLSTDKKIPFALPLLSLSRLMFIAQHPKRFSTKLMFELQGIVDKDKKSPFWQALGQHFFNMDFHKANYLTGINSKGFIADLMPRHPVYVPLLTKQAQEVIGQQRPDMKHVHTLLTNEGFAQQGYVSIFDAGPTLEAQVDEIRTINQQLEVCAKVEASLSEHNNTAQVTQSVLVTNSALAGFRSIHMRISEQQFHEIKHTDQEKPKALILDQQQANALDVVSGDTLFMLPLSRAQLAVNN